MMTRRALLGSASLIPLAAIAALPGCSAFTALAPKIVGYAGTIADAISLILPSIKTLTGLAGGAYNTIAWLAGQVKDTATKIATATTADAAGLVTTLSGAAGSIVGMLAGIPSLPGIVSTVAANVMALLPALEGLVGIGATPYLPTVAARRFAAMAPLTPDQAYANLRAVLAGAR
jgi:hypothetical protein